MTVLVNHLCGKDGNKRPTPMTIQFPVNGPEARAHIDQLSRKYTGGNYSTTIHRERVILKISPDRQYIRRPEHYSPVGD